MLKMPGLKGVLTFHADIKTAYTCNVHSCELAEEKNAEIEHEDIRQDIEAIKEVDRAPPAEAPLSKKATKEKFKVDQVASKTIPLDPTDPSKVTHIGADLEAK